jgi:predicted Zn-dependent peptidase
MSARADDCHPERTQLTNGLTVLSEELPGRRSLALGVWLKTGARDEPPTLVGVSHFLEHMLFKGTERRTAYDIANSLESRGGQLDAFTTREYVCYYARCLEEHGDLALDVLSDIVGHSTLPDEEIEREKSVVREEIQSYEDNPEEKVADVLSEALWGADPLGWPILGTLESLEGLRSSEVRRFYRQRYGPRSLVITAAGRVDHAWLAEKVSSLFDSSGGDGTHGAGPPKPLSPRVASIEREVAQTYLALGRPAVPQGDPRRYALAVLNAIVGGGMSSRLFQSVRETAALAYSIYSSLDFFRDAGTLSIFLGVRPERAGEALRRVAEELNRFRREGPSEEEMQAGRSQIRGNLILGQESVTNHMTHLAMDELYHGHHIPLDDHLEKVAAVTTREVTDLAQEYLRPESYTLAAVAPEGAESELAKAWPL